MEELNLDAAIKSDIDRYKRILEKYRLGTAKSDKLVRGDVVENTKETERHLENVIRELEALLRDRVRN